MNAIENTEERLAARADGSLYRAVYVNGVEDPARATPDPLARHIPADSVTPGMAEREIILLLRKWG